MPKTFNGVDVNSSNGQINWGRVKNAGIDFAIISAGEIRGNGFRQDRYFEKNIKGASENKIPAGVLIRVSESSSNQETAKSDGFIGTLEKYRNLIALPVFLKAEEISGQQRQTDEETIKSIADKIGKRGFSAGLCIDSAERGRIFSVADLWLWQENMRVRVVENTVVMPDGVAVWRYTSNGRVDGIPGAVGMNVGFKDYLARRTRKVHIVRSGETLLAIAQRNNTT